MSKIDISIVIPAYNEAKKLPLFLKQLISYCIHSKKVYEIIIVDDGSYDKTFEIAESYKVNFCNLHTIKIRKNRGKGHAVKRGILKSNGEICLFLDADGSTCPEEIEKNIHYILEKNYDIFIGSRALKDKEQILKVKWYRKLMGKIFNFFVHAFFLEDIKDTQCGFKMFKKEVVRPLFSRSYLQGFGFDIEILYLAHKMGYKVKEGPISWHHVGGGKINPFMDSIRMFFNILQVKNWHYTPIHLFAEHMGPDEYKYMYELEEYHWWFVTRRNLLIHLIKSLKISFPTILDVSTGTGANLVVLSKLGNAFGIDISEKAVEFCRKRGLKNVIQSSAEKIKYRKEAFDIVTCLDVLEHVSNPLEVLIELKRVLKNKGKIIITVPAFRILYSQHDEALCHLRRYEKSSLLSDLHEAGLNVKKIGYFFFASFFIVAPIRIMKKFLVPSQKPYSDTTAFPPKFLNEFLKFLFKIEVKVLDSFKLPFGTTIYVVASKKI